MKPCVELSGGGLSRHPIARFLKVVAAPLALAATTLFAGGCPAPGAGERPPLPAPTAVTAAALSSSSIRIGWLPPVGSEGSNVYRSDLQAGAFSRINPSIVASSFYDDVNLAPGTAYWYKVIALKSGSEQTMSSASCGTTASAAAPQNVKVGYLSASSLRVNWDMVTGVDGYNIYRGTSLAGPYFKVNDVPADEGQYDDSGLSASTEYWYKVAGTVRSAEQGQSGGAEGYTARRWARSYGGTGNDAALSARQTSEGGYIVAGTRGSAELWVLKLDLDGAVSWQKTYGQGQATCIQQTADNGYVVCGGTGPFAPNNGDVCVLKLDSTGAISWQKTYGGSAADGAISIQQTLDGGYAVCGTTNSFGAGGSDIWILKLDSSGAVGWQKTYGGTGWDSVSGFQQTSDGGYVVAGTYHGTYDHFWLLKLNTDGNIGWQKQFNSGAADSSSSIQQTADGGYIASGQTYFYRDFWVLKLTSDGTVTWQRAYGGSSEERTSVIRQTSDGGFLLVGMTLSYGSAGDFWMLKLTSDGAVSWQKDYGSDSECYDSPSSIQQTADGGYVVAGCTGFGTDGADMWVIKLPDNGQLYAATFAHDTSASVVDVEASSSVTSVTASDSAVVVGDSSVTAQDSNAVVMTQYP